MMQFLFQKEENPQIVGTYSPETDKLTCSQNQDELEEYFEKNPHKAMPYGFPAISKDEYNLIMTWLDENAIDDTKVSITNFEKKQIKKLEDFLNNSSIFIFTPPKFRHFQHRKQVLSIRRHIQIRTKIGH